MIKEENAIKLRDYIQDRPKLFIAIVKTVTALALVLSVFLLPYTFLKNKL